MILSIIIPCFNYENNIFKNIKKINSKIKKKFNNYEIIIINDGSTDGTLVQLKKIKKKIKNVKIINNKNNLGKSTSISKGIKISKGKKIFLYDCDLPYWNYINFFLNKLSNNDFVLIDRKNKKSKLLKRKTSLYQKIRQFIGRVISFIINIFLDINILDTQSGMKGFINSKKLKKLNFISKKFFLDVEIIYFMKKNNINPIKIPVKYEIPKNSTIKLFSLKNILIILELFLVLISLKFFYNKRNQLKS